MNLRQYEEKMVKLVDTDGDEFIGYATDYCFPDDNEPEGIASITLMDVSGYTNPIEFYENQIKSIEIID